MNIDDEKEQLLDYLAKVLTSDGPLEVQPGSVEESLKRRLLGIFESIPEAAAVTRMHESIAEGAAAEDSAAVHPVPLPSAHNAEPRESFSVASLRKNVLLTNLLKIAEQSAESMASLARAFVDDATELVLHLQGADIDSSALQNYAFKKAHSLFRKAVKNSMGNKWQTKFLDLTAKMSYEEFCQFEGQSLASNIKSHSAQVMRIDATPAAIRDYKNMIQEEFEKQIRFLSRLKIAPQG